MNIRSGIVWRIAATLLITALHVQGAGVTVVTHGYDGGVDGGVGVPLIANNSSAVLLNRTLPLQFNRWATIIR